MKRYITSYINKEWLDIEMKQTNSVGLVSRNVNITYDEGSHDYAN